jgi:hypothetical protein
MKFLFTSIPSIIIIGLIAVVQTYLLRGHSLVGDGTFYKDTFDTLSSTGFFDGYEVFQEKLGASEYISYIVFFLASKIFDYDVFSYFSNIVFSLSIYLVYQKYNKGIASYLITVPLNFYFLVLCFGAQRLKFAMLFLMLAFYVGSRFRTRIFGTLALFSHFQVIITLAAEQVRKAFSGAVRVRYLEVAIVCVLCVFVVASVPVLQVKILSYVLERGPLNIVPFLFSFMIAAAFSRFNVGVMAEFTFFLVLIFIVGESRINILVFCSLWRIIFLCRASPALISYVIAAYLSFKGANFMIDILNGGTGFAIS